VVGAVLDCGCCGCKQGLDLQGLQLSSTSIVNLHRQVEMPPSIKTMCLHQFCMLNKKRQIITIKSINRYLETLPNTARHACESRYAAVSFFNFYYLDRL
jgi:hypothetical protein